MTKHYKIIHDPLEIHKFYRRVLPQLKPLEVYFLSLSARNKYLTEEERTSYGLGRTEMFAKTIVRHNTFQDYLKHVYRFECNKYGYLTRSGLPIPEKALVCYANICPSSTTKAVTKFQNLLAEYNEEALNLATEGRDYNNFINRMNKVDNNLLTFYQNSHSSKRWVDIDIDLNNIEDDLNNIKIIDKCTQQFGVSPGKVVLIQTKSGFHVLLEKNHIKRNPKELVDLLQDSLDAKEVTINKNEMVPLPGTYQAGFEVKFRYF